MHDLATASVYNCRYSTTTLSTVSTTLFLFFWLVRMTGGYRGANSKDFVIACVVLTQRVRVCGMDRQTDSFAIAKTGHIYSKIC